MSRKKEIAYLKSLSVEERAKKAEKPMSCLVSSVLFFPCLFLGIYYWAIDETIFSYDEIPSFLGFVIFFSIGVILPFIASGVNFLYWREYNLLIDQANSDIASLIKHSKGDPKKIERLRTDYVERIIGTEKLTQEDFLWHSNTYCWGCGKKHQITPMKFVIHREKTESWKGRDVMRYSQTFRITDSIMLCPNCYQRVSNSKNKDTKWSFSYTPKIYHFTNTRLHNSEYSVYDRK